MGYTTTSYEAPIYGLSDYQQAILEACYQRFNSLKSGSEDGVIDIDSYIEENYIEYGFSSLQDIEDRIELLKVKRPAAVIKLQNLIEEALAGAASSSAGVKGLIIEALAGTGKSTILVEICKLADSMRFEPDEIRLIVFGNKNKADLQSKLVDKVGISWKDSVSTIHSLGYSILKQALGWFKVDGNKYKKIAQDLGYCSYYSYKEKKKIYGSLQLSTLTDSNPILPNETDFYKLIDLVRLNCLEADYESVKDLIKEYKIEAKWSSILDIAQALSRVLKRGYEQTHQGKVIDFTDMSHAVWINRELPKVQAALKSFGNQFSMIAIDEAQDTDKLQMEMVKLLQNDKNFIVPVGDKYQAVYSFRGCVEDGLATMERMFNCDRLSLPVNYRCGIKHLELVRTLYPHIQIEPSPQASEGEIRCVRESKLLDLIQSDKEYLGVSRKNAPLLTTAIKLICNGYPARIKDKSLGNKILSLVENIYRKIKKRYQREAFPEDITKYVETESERYMKYPDYEERIEALQDLVECLFALFDAYEDRLNSLKDWREVVNEICDESEYAPIQLYTGHSGKGAEADTVLWINPGDQPLRFKNQTAVEQQQEQNLIYVMATRVKSVLWLVLSEKDGNIKYPSWLPEEYREEYKF